MSNEQLKHTFVASSDLDSMPTANGRIFGFTDKAGMGYEVNNHRYRVLGGTDDTTNNKVTFTSYDTSTSPASLTDMPAIMQSNQTHGTLFSKLSIAMHNLRYLIRLIGSTDISSIGNGTITGAISNVDGRIGFKGTQAQYEAAVQQGLITEGMTVMITDDYSNSAVNAMYTITNNFEVTGDASKAYRVGEYMMYNDSLAVVTAAIAQDDELVIGTNIRLTTIGQSLTSQSAAVSGNTSSHGLLPLALSHESIPTGVEFTGTGPALVTFVYNHTYHVWYARCTDWDGNLMTNAEYSGTVYYYTLS